MTTLDQGMRFGGFVINGMKLAFPLSSLREVLPYQDLLEIPSPAQCVVGGLGYKQAILPVIDLCRLLGQSQAIHPAKCILVVVVGEYVFGLLADAVSGIFLAAPDSYKEALTTDLLSSVFMGSIVRQDDHSLVSILSLEKIANADHFPMIADPESARQSHDNDQVDNDNNALQATSTAMMLVKCGPLDIAIDAVSVHTTIAGFTIEKSALAMGNCLGVIHYMGVAIPLIDFQAFCGFGRRTINTQKAAFIIALEAGKVAFLIDHIIDIVGIETTIKNEVPSFVLPHPALFSGILPSSTLPTDLAQKLNPQSQCLVIDIKAFFAMPEVINLASTNTFIAKQFAQSNSHNDVAQHQVPHGRAMLLYDAGMLMATPIDQISMILPYSTNMNCNQTKDLFLGLVESRGKTIPLINLCRMHGVDELELTSSTCVLVTELEQQSIGFLVKELKTIANAMWEPEISELSHSLQEPATPQKKTQLALFHIADQQKMLHVKDLIRLTSELQAAGFQTTQEPVGL